VLAFEIAFFVYELKVYISYYYRNLAVSDPTKSFILLPERDTGRSRIRLSVTKATIIVMVVFHSGLSLVKSQSDNVILNRREF